MTYNNNLKIYKIVDFPKKQQMFGEYKSTHPKKAGEQAFSMLSNIIGDIINEDSKFIVFTMIDINSKKEYKYIGTRIKLENPVRETVNGVETIYEYKNVIGNYNKELDKLKS